MAVVLSLFMQQVFAESGDSLEYRVKAAFLFNFIKFVDWPAGTFAGMDAPIDVCVLGADPFGSILDEAINSKVVNRHELRVKRISKTGDVQNCKILFVGSSERSRLRDVITAARNQSVLTVSELPEFTDAGGMIRFVIVDGKVNFDINRNATDQAHIAVSSKLLSVAHAVLTSGSGS